MEGISNIVNLHTKLNKNIIMLKFKQILHDCRHGMDLLCGASVSEAVCPEICGMTLDCGHICPLPCHKRSSHDTIQCKQPCQRLCSDQHGCEKKCFEDCGNCLTKMTKLLPCGHEVKI